MCSLDARNGNHPRRPLSHLFLRSLLPALALLSCVGVFSPTFSHAADEGKEISKEQKDVLEVVKKLQGRYEQTKDLQAEFQQTTRIEGFATPLTSSGRMSIKKPGLLRWDYREPTVEEIYVTRNDVMMYVPEHKQVLVGKLTQMAASQAPLQLLQGVAKIDEEFEIESTRGDERGEGGLPLITLTPKSTEPDASRSVSKLVLEVQPKTYFIKAVTIHEVSGNISTFVFSNLKPNTGLKSGVFEFKVPAGVEVVKAPTLSPP
jgi:outer membrane lipoprotein carrier protein